MTIVRALTTDFDDIDTHFSTGAKRESKSIATAKEAMARARAEFGHDDELMAHIALEITAFQRGVTKTRAGGTTSFGHNKKVRRIKGKCRRAIEERKKTGKNSDHLPPVQAEILAFRYCSPRGTGNSTITGYLHQLGCADLDVPPGKPQRSASARTIPKPNLTKLEQQVEEMQDRIAGLEAALRDAVPKDRMKRELQTVKERAQNYTDEKVTESTEQLEDKVMAKVGTLERMFKVFRDLFPPGTKKRDTPVQPTQAANQPGLTPTGNKTTAAGKGSGGKTTSRSYFVDSGAEEDTPSKGTTVATSTRKRSRPDDGTEMEDPPNRQRARKDSGTNKDSVTPRRKDLPTTPIKSTTKSTPGTPRTPRTPGTKRTPTKK